MTGTSDPVLELRQEVRQLPEDRGGPPRQAGPERRTGPNPRLAAMYVERCATLQADPPEDWQGVWVMKTK